MVAACLRFLDLLLLSSATAAGCACASLLPGCAYTAMHWKPAQRTSASHDPRTRNVSALCLRCGRCSIVPQSRGRIAPVAWPC